MPDLLDWRSDDSQDVLARVCRHLRSGELVVLPTESGYEAVASALDPGAVADLGEIAAPDEPLAMILGEAVEIFDWLPYLRGPGLRLLRAFWPGPLTLVSAAGAKEGLARVLPSEVRARLLPQGELAVRFPDHEWPGPLRRMLAGPLAAAPLPGFPNDVGEIVKDRDRFALMVNDGPSAFVKPSSVVRAEAKSVSVVREGAVPRQDLEAAAPCRILFVCTGNTCRSPLAETLCRALLSAKLRCAPAELSQCGYEVQSAGMAAALGNPATPEAADLAPNYGADLSRHRSQPLSLELLSQADFVFTMTRSHLSLLESLRVPAGPTPQLLSPSGADVDDPIGCSEDVYRTCAQQIWQYLNERLAEIQES